MCFRACSKRICKLALVLSKVTVIMSSACANKPSYFVSDAVMFAMSAAIFARATLVAQVVLALWFITFCFFGSDGALALAIDETKRWQGSASTSQVFGGGPAQRRITCHIVHRKRDWFAPLKS